jgi:hypothetical protein
VDSADSILMLYSYAGFHEKKKWAFIKWRPSRTLATPPEQGEDRGSISCRELDTEPDQEKHKSPTEKDIVISEPLSQGRPYCQLSGHIETPFEMSNDGTKNTCKTPPDRTLANATSSPLPDTVALERTTRVKLNTILVALRCSKFISPSSHEIRSLFIYSNVVYL